MTLSTHTLSDYRHHKQALARARAWLESRKLSLEYLGERTQYLSHGSQAWQGEMQGIRSRLHAWALQAREREESTLAALRLCESESELEAKRELAILAQGFELGQARERAHACHYQSVPLSLHVPKLDASEQVLARACTTGKARASWLRDPKSLADLRHGQGEDSSQERDHAELILARIASVRLRAWELAHPKCEQGCERELECGHARKLVSEQALARFEQASKRASKHKPRLVQAYARALAWVSRAHASARKLLGASSRLSLNSLRVKHGKHAKPQAPKRELDPLLVNQLNWSVGELRELGQALKHALRLEYREPNSLTSEHYYRVRSLALETLAILQASRERVRELRFEQAKPKRKAQAKKRALKRKLASQAKRAREALARIQASERA